MHNNNNNNNTNAKYINELHKKWICQFSLAPSVIAFVYCCNKEALSVARWFQFSNGYFFFFFLSCELVRTTSWLYMSHIYSQYSSMPIEDLATLSTAFSYFADCFFFSSLKLLFEHHHSSVTSTLFFTQADSTNNKIYSIFFFLLLTWCLLNVLCY